ncbi:MAG: hypothetical protein ACE5I1_13800, partial [bacterium]
MKSDIDIKSVRWSASISSLVAVVCLAWWISYDPTADLITSVPGMDNRPAESTTALYKAAVPEAVHIGEFM